MDKRVKVNLLPGWTDYSYENPEGPPTFLRDASSESGPLQVSWAWYASGKEPNPTDEELIGLAKGFGKGFDEPELLETSSGKCAIGRYGTAVFRTKESARVQAWYLSNGRDFVTVTHIGVGQPEPEEVAGAQQIVEQLRIVEVAEQPQERDRRGGIGSLFRKLLKRRS
jgi:hypothetical protein